MKIGLVTVLYNSDEVLPDFFESVSKQSYKNYLLILVDNSPSINTNIVLSELKSNYNIDFLHLPMSQNIGVAAANNIGIKTAFQNNCDSILILNNDIAFSQNNCFESLIEIAQKQKIIVTKILYYNTKKVWYGGGLFRNWFGFVKHLGCGSNELNPNINIPKYTNYAPTCFAFVVKEVFDKVGLMDEQYFVYADDTDFMYRAYLAGFKVWYEPKLVIEHKISQSTGGMTSDFSLYYDTRNKIYYSRKFNGLFFQLTSIFFTTTLTFFFALKENRKSAIKAVKKAIFDGFKMKLAN